MIQYGDQTTSINDCLKCVDKILIIGDDTNIIEEYDKNKVIGYEPFYSEGRVIGYKFNFGPIHNQYLIILPTLQYGLYWYFRKYITEEKFMNRTPYVDMQNYFNPYISPLHLGLYNVWDIYFNQYTDKTCEEIYSCDDVVCIFVSTDEIPIAEKLSTSMLSNHMRDMLEEKKKQFADIDKSIGVNLRGTDYIRYPWHEIPYDGYEAAEVVKRYLYHYKLNKVFIMTEDLDNFDAFYEIFGNNLLFIERERYHKENRDVKNPADDYTAIEVGEKYILEMFLLQSTYGVLMGPGSSTDSVNRIENNLAFKYKILKKNRHLEYGLYPLWIESIGKNRIDLSKINYKDENLVVSSEKGVLNIQSKNYKKTTIPLIKKREISLERGMKYYFSSTI